MPTRYTLLPKSGDSPENHAWEILRDEGGIQTVTAHIGPKRYKICTTLSDEQRYILELLGLNP